MGRDGTAEGLVSGAIRALRRPQTGLAAVLAEIAAETEVDIAAAYLVPARPDDVELVAAAGPAAGSLGPPGRAPERIADAVRTLGLELAVTNRPQALIDNSPWNGHAHVDGIATLLSDYASCVLVVASPDPVDAALLLRASASVGMLVQALSQEREITRLKAELHQIEQDRSLVASTLQHDLKTPLTAILGYASTLRNREAALSVSSRNEMLDSIVCQANRLNRMISETVEREREGLHRPIQLHRSEVAPLVARVAATASRGRRGRVVVECPEGIEMCTDVDRLERALLNLVDNAIKYSPESTPVHVIVESTPSAVAITVADNGPGVSPEVLPGLFGAYATDPGRSDGTGLGLHSARHIADELGGRVDYARVQGWTRFTISVAREGTGERSDGVRGTSGSHGRS